MALELTHVVNGVTMTNAYHKVSHVSGNKDKLHVDVEICASSNDPAMDSFSFVMESADMSHAEDSADRNYTKQAYEHLKSGAITDLSGNARDLSSATDV